MLDCVKSISVQATVICPFCGTDLFVDRGVGGEVHVAKRDRVSLEHLEVSPGGLRGRIQIHSPETTRGTGGQRAAVPSELRRSIVSR